MPRFFAPPKDNLRQISRSRRSVFVRRFAVVTAAGVAFGLPVPGQAFAEPGPSSTTAERSAPTPVRKNGHKNSAMIDGDSGVVDATAGAAADGGSVPPRKQPSGMPFTQKQLGDGAKTRAIAENQRSFVESSTLDRQPRATTAAAPGNDLPTSPLEGDQNECLNAAGADSDYGRVHNRYLYCLKSDTNVHYWEVDNKGNPVEEVGTSKINFLVMAYGSKQSRSIRVFLKTIEDSAAYDWGPIDNITKAPKQHLVVDVRCINNVLDDTRCVLGGYAVSKTFGDWDDGPDWVSWDITSTKPTQSESDVDYKWLHEWQITFQGGAEDEYKTIAPGHTASRSMRCDSAAYFNRPKQPEACIFNDVIPHLEYSTQDKGPKPTDGVAEVAVHIREAQDNPNATYPLVSPPRDKRIPGKFTGSRNDPPLHRIPNTDPKYKENGVHKNAACYGNGTERDNYIGLGLPTPPDTSYQDCDEYPFASTSEGAANTNWDFSVKAVNLSQNRRAGRRLGEYFSSDRILQYDRDAFYVNITDTPVYDPGNDNVVDAGPDVSGTEGSMIRLAGAADAAEEGSVRWSVRPVSGTDAGATCTFQDAEAPDTYITCQDDGVFEAILTSDDGIDAARSDTALVTVGNAPPVLQLSGPRPWQLFRVNTPVDLAATFTDSGANDTHTCAINWDDSRSDSFGAADNCNRSHIFTRAGMFTIGVTVTDDDGASDSATVMIIVYDPHAGFVNADGSVAAPAGSLTTTPGASGEAWFHLAARYYAPNDTVPVGDARTWLTGTGFRFDTSGGDGLDWLVVTPDGKMAAKGRGTVDGQAGYGFVFYGYDGCDNGGAPGCRPGPDQFRMVVWTGGPNSYPTDATTFDTSRGADYDVDAAVPKTTISGRVNIQK
ncbi:PKD domain-containing protein [Micromonospora ureilytica]|uniref:NucA/NucB deoxyribonuclease domain-containing protein n=1 Tax=Micromonospora ureilytica TaxID=709868 RepID=UPI002E0F14FB|nr:PKD domain-containing protein [Micromonospora ureilytica]